MDGVLEIVLVMYVALLPARRFCTGAYIDGEGQFTKPRMYCYIVLAKMLYVSETFCYMYTAVSLSVTVIKTDTVLSKIMHWRQSRDFMSTFYLSKNNHLR